VPRAPKRDDNYPHPFDVDDATEPVANIPARSNIIELRPVLAELAELSLREQAAELNRRGVPTPAGGQWHAVTVKRVRSRLASTTFR
jgi:hypothetical protein